MPEQGICMPCVRDSKSTAMFTSGTTMSKHCCSGRGNFRRKLSMTESRRTHLDNIVEVVYRFTIGQCKEKTTMKACLAILGAIGLVLLLAACDARSVEVDTNPANITYSRDARTDLCFASLGRAGGASVTDRARSFSMTNVPCTAEVLVLVPKNQGGSL